MSSLAGAAGPAVADALASSKWTNQRLLKYGTAIAFLAWLSRKLASTLSRTVLGLKRELYPLEEWAAQYDEDAIDTDIAIFDCHHHLGDARTWAKGWEIHKHWLLTFWFYSLKPRIQTEMAASNPLVKDAFGERCPNIVPYMGEEFLGDHRGPNGRGHRVVGSIFLEWGWTTPGVEQKCMEPVKEADAASAIHQKFPQIVNGVIPFADLTLGAEVEPALQYYKQNPLVVGIRYSLAWDKDILGGPGSENTAYDAKFREGFALLSKYGFTFDSWHYHTQVDGLADLARAFPDTPIICNHMGMPLGLGGHRPEESRPIWEESMRKLAVHKNVSVKIGGFGMRMLGFGFDERPKPPTSDELAKAWGPYVLFVIQNFGVDRCMMESNFPMDKISTSYTVLFNALKKIVRSYSMEDKRKMFELNAKRVYKIK